MSNAHITTGQIVKTVYGHIGRVFSNNGTTVTLIQDRDDIYQEIGVFHHSKIISHA